MRQDLLVTGASEITHDPGGAVAYSPMEIPRKMQPRRNLPLPLKIMTCLQVCFESEGTGWIPEHFVIPDVKQSAGGNSMKRLEEVRVSDL